MAPKDKAPSHRGHADLTRSRSGPHDTGPGKRGQEASRLPRTVNFGIPRRPLMSAFIHIFTYVGLPAAILAIGRIRWIFSRSRLLERAGDTALKTGDKNPRGRAALEIIKSLNGENEPWYRAILPWRRSDGGES
jgi:hypothetical protein